MSTILTSRCLNSSCCHQSVECKKRRDHPWYIHDISPLSTEECKNHYLLRVGQKHIGIQQKPKKLHILLILFFCFFFVKNIKSTWIFLAICVNDLKTKKKSKRVRHSTHDVTNMTFCCSTTELCDIHLVSDRQWLASSRDWQRLYVSIIVKQSHWWLSGLSRHLTDMKCAV